MTGSDEERMSFSAVIDRLENEIAIATRHLELLEIVGQSEPVGMTELADRTRYDHSKIRYSLRVLEEENLVEPSSKGASTTDKVSTAIVDCNDKIGTLRSRLESQRDHYREDANDSAASTDGPAETDDRLPREQRPDVATGASITETDRDETDSQSTTGRADTGATETAPSSTEHGEDTPESVAESVSSVAGDGQTDGANTTEPERLPDVSTVSSPERRSLEYEEFEIGETLGHGGSAVVHEAWFQDGDDRVPVALKVPNFDGTIGPAVIEAFEREAENWSNLSTREHVVGVVDSGTQPRPWIALEHMDGGTVADRVGECSVDQTVWTVERIAQAVRHDKTGLVHLDLKPDNILFRDTGTDTWDVPKVADWGLARTLKHHQPTVDGLSPTYAAPEQFDADAFGEPSSQTDIYQLGVLLYELLTGHPPFEGSDVAVMNSIINDEPDPPASVSDEIPQVLSDITLRTLEKRQADRFSTVERLQSELQQLL